MVGAWHIILHVCTARGISYIHVCTARGISLVVYRTPCGISDNLWIMADVSLRDVTLCHYQTNIRSVTHVTQCQLYVGVQAGGGGGGGGVGGGVIE